MELSDGLRSLLQFLEDGRQIAQMEIYLRMGATRAEPSAAEIAEARGYTEPFVPGPCLDAAAEQYAFADRLIRCELPLRMETFLGHVGHLTKKALQNQKLELILRK